jgi:carbonic anhydrase
MAEATIVRNAGGRVKSSITDLLFIETFTQGQAVKEVIVIHHTGNLSLINLT